MNVKNYKDKKEKGLAEVVEAGGGHALEVKKYSEDDGIEVESEVLSVNIKDLSTERDNLLLEIEDYDLLIADITTLSKEG